MDKTLATSDATSWHNTDRDDASTAAAPPGFKALRQAVPDFRFDDCVYQGWDDGFLVQYVVRGTLPDGKLFKAPACLVGRVRDGKIFRTEEYLDSAQLKGLRDAINAV